jgi:hypothetical protein
MRPTNACYHQAETVEMCRLFGGTMKKQRREEGDLKPVEKFSIRQFREAGMSIQQLSGYFNVSMATVYRALAEMREKFGPEALPRARRQLARPTLQTSLRGHNTQVDHAEKHR